MKYSSLHSHSQFSGKDALRKVPDMVDRAVELGYEALGLTDHGTMGGAAQLYTACRKAGLEPMPGIEAYVWLDRRLTRGKSHPYTQHMGLLATSDRGYENLVGLSNHMHQRFYTKPVLDFDDLAAYAEDGMLEGIAVMTGCWFGLVPTLVREGNPSGVLNMVRALDNWFGSGCYVEIQNHQIERQDGWDENDFNEVLFGIAEQAGLPVVITQDSHYIHENEREQHELFKRLSSWSDDPDDAVFPGDGYHMVDADWMADHHPQHIYDAGMAGIADLVSKAKVVIPALDQFKLQVPDTTLSGNPDAELRELAEKGLAEVLADLPKTKHKAYRERVEAEFEVIEYAGFSGYLLLIRQITQWCTEQGIRWDIRGSALGSMVCWLIGITGADPIKWNLPFERFLSRDHRNPPDIDIDIVHTRRDEVMEWMSQRYHGYRIGAWSKLGLDDDEDGKGSLVDMWKRSEGKKRALSFADTLKIDVPWQIQHQLDKLDRLDPMRGCTVHAAGMLAVPDEAALGPVPMQWMASSGTFMTAFDKKDIESLGLLKVDLLKLRTMTALDLMEQTSGVLAKDIPLDDAKVFRAMAKGDVGKAFQISGYTAKAGFKRLRPSSIKDVIAGVALFRPAAMDSGAADAYIARKHKEEEVRQYHPILMEQTKDTYGVVVFQEQAMKMLQNLGLPLEDLDKAKKAIKASNGDTEMAKRAMAEIITKVKDTCVVPGLTDDDWAYVENALGAYAGYGFNRAHATGYGLIGYQTLWYLVNHPVEYWAATMEASRGIPGDVETQLAQEARRYGIKFRSPHINRSKAGYTADIANKAIRKGLSSIKGIGEETAEKIAANAPYTSMKDFADRNSRIGGIVQLRKGHSPAACGGVVQILHDAGALDSIPLT